MLRINNGIASTKIAFSSILHDFCVFFHYCDPNCGPMPDFLRLQSYTKRCGISRAFRWSIQTSGTAMLMRIKIGKTDKMNTLNIDPPRPLWKENSYQKLFLMIIGISHFVEKSTASFETLFDSKGRKSVGKIRRYRQNTKNLIFLRKKYEHIFVTEQCFSKAESKKLIFWI